MNTGLFTTVEDRLRALEHDVAALKQRAAAPPAPAAAPPATAPAPFAGGKVADDAELDSKFGDEPIRRDPSPKYWAGASCVGMPFSRCPPDYLDAMAKYKDACAYANEKEGNPEKAKYIAYDRRDAARARGWAARLRAGWKGAGMASGVSAASQPAAYNSDADEGDVFPF